MPPSRVDGDRGERRASPARRSRRARPSRARRAPCTTSCASPSRRLVSPLIALTMTTTSWPARCAREGAARDVANAVDGADRRAAELLDDEGHGDGGPLDAGTRDVNRGDLTRAPLAAVESCQSGVTCPLTRGIFSRRSSRSAPSARSPSSSSGARGGPESRGRPAPWRFVATCRSTRGARSTWSRSGIRSSSLGVGEGGFTKLGEMAACELPDATTTARTSRFGDVLSRLLAKPAAGERRDP